MASFIIRMEEDRLPIMPQLDDMLREICSTHRRDLVRSSSPSTWVRLTEPTEAGQREDSTSARQAHSTPNVLRISPGSAAYHRGILSHHTSDNKNPTPAQISLAAVPAPCRSLFGQARVYTRTGAPALWVLPLIPCLRVPHSVRRIPRRPPRSGTVGARVSTPQRAHRPLPLDAARHH